MESKAEEYRLMYHGADDESADTLRKIKGVFLADLEIPADEIVSIISNAPAQVLKANSVEELTHAFTLLKNAGSKVLILSKDGLPVEFAPEQDSGDTLVFELDDVAFEKKEEPVATYSLSLEDEEEDDLALVLKEVAAEVGDFEEDTKSIDPILTEANNTFELQIDAELEEVLQTRDNKKANEPELELKTQEPESIPQPALEQTTKTATEDEPFNLTLRLDDEPPSTPQVKADAQAKEEPKPTVTKFEQELSLAIEPETPAPKPEKIAVESVVVAKETPQESTPQVQEVKEEPKKVEAPVKEVKATPPQVKTPPPPPAAAISENATPPDINMVAVRDRRKKKLPPGVDMAFFVILGSALLFVANWMYFNAPPPAEDHATIEAQEVALKSIQKKKELVKKQRAEAEAKARELEALRKPTVFKSETTIGDTKVVVAINYAGEVPKTIDFTIEDKEPAELTNEEIAAGVIPRAWIRRIETSPFEILQAATGELSAEATSKIFVEYKGVPTRLVKKTVIRGSRGVSEETPFTVTVTVDDGAQDYSEDSWVLEEQAGAIVFSMSKKIELTLAKQETQVVSEKSSDMKEEVNAQE